MKRSALIVILVLSICTACHAMGGKPPQKAAERPQQVDVETQATEYTAAQTPEAVKGEAPQMLKDKTILLIIASKDFRDEEYAAPRAIFENYGAKVVVASSKMDVSTGVNGAKVKPDILLKDARIRDYNAFVFVGGPGAKEYFDDPTAHTIAANAYASRKPVAAICIAPVILANSGILGGKKATVSEGESGRLQEEGAIYTGADVEVFGNVITANGPEAAEKFAEAVAAMLAKK